MKTIIISIIMGYTAFFLVGVMAYQKYRIRLHINEMCEELRATNFRPRRNMDAHNLTRGKKTLIGARF